MKGRIRPLKRLYYDTTRQSDKHEHEKPPRVLAPPLVKSQVCEDNSDMRKPFVVALCLLAELAVGAPLPTRSQAKPTSAQPRRAKAPAKRRSVIDSFYLLSHFGIGRGTRREKSAALQPRHHPIIDLRHDYLQVHPDSSPAEQIAVFRARGKSDLIADSMPDSVSDYNFFALYRLQDGRLKDVTRQTLPMPARTGTFLYELPRIGTTIRVFRFDLKTASRRHAFDLKWRGGRFVKVP